MVAIFNEACANICGSWIEHINGVLNMEMDDILKYVTIGCSVAALVLFIVSQGILTGASASFNSIMPLVLTFIIIYVIIGVT